MSKQFNFLSLKTAIRTKNYEASTAFYSKVLHLTIVQQYSGEKGVRGCILRIGDEQSNAFIEISEIAPTHYYFDASFQKGVANDKIDLQIKTESVDYWAEHLKGKCELRGPVDRPWGARYLYLRDPDGLQIIIYEE